LAAVIWLGGCACLTAAEGAPDDVDVQMLSHAAEQNDAEAQLRLARMYAQGKGVKQDWEEAYVWAMLARKKRQPDAARLSDEAASKLAVKQLLSGIRRVREFKPQPPVPFASIPLPVDAKWAAQVKARRDKARDGSADEAYQLGALLYERAALPQEFMEVFIWIKKAADQGHPLAQYRMAGLYFEGRGIPQDPAKGIQWVQKCLPGLKVMAEKGEAAAQLNYGELFLMGIDVDMDLKVGFKWVRRAADQGHAPALATLGKARSLGFGLEKDVKKGTNLLEKAAEAGNREATALLGAIHVSGMFGPRDPKSGIAWLQKAANWGDGEAQANLASCHLHGMGVPKNPSKGVLWLQRSVRRGNPQAMWKLAECYREGNGVARNDTQAENLSREAIPGVEAMLKKPGNMMSSGYAILLGRAYAQGIGVKQNYFRAFHWFREAAKDGDLEGKYRMAHGLMSGAGTEKDVAEGRKWLQRAAEGGFVKAQFEMGEMFYFGSEETGCDFKEARKWYAMAAAQEADFLSGMFSHLRVGGIYDLKKNNGVLEKLTTSGIGLAKAKKGGARAQYIWGIRRLFGFGVEPNEADALKWLFAAAEAGDVNAQNALGEYFFEKALKGKDSREHAMALKYFEMAAQKEHESARASLGLLLLKWGKPPGDKARGLRLLQQAAKAEKPRAYQFLSSAYHEGMGVAKDEQKAFHWNLKAAQAKNSGYETLGNLALFYYQGRGVEKNMREGLKWSLKAAHHGNVGAMLDLGARYLRGEFGAVDIQKGVYWTRLAAGFNNPAAQSHLSLCYALGVGVTRDVVEALKWATLAARQGDDKGQGLLIQAKAIMESKEGDKVRVRVAEWRSISPPRGLLHMFGVQAK